MESFGLTLLAITYACFMLIAISEKTGPISWLTRLPLLRRLGLLAYCIYLIHMLVFELLGWAVSLPLALFTAARSSGCMTAAFKFFDPSINFADGRVIAPA